MQILRRSSLSYQMQRGKSKPLSTVTTSPRFSGGRNGDKNENVDTANEIVVVKACFVIRPQGYETE